MKENILLIEDDRLMRISLEDALKGTGYDVMSFESGTDALRALKLYSFNAAVTDFRLPDIDGFEVVRGITERSDMPVVVMTAYGTIKDAVEAMKLGAFDYITKPFSLDEFLLLINRALKARRLKEENIRLKNDPAGYCLAPNIIGKSAAMEKVFSLIEKVSASDSMVLIHGESGTGKELIATTIHYQSDRKVRPLIKVNCASLPEGLIESELFGFEKGAFTGAVRRKPGRFELANRGTIFLDEIADLPLSTQSKILRVLQEKTFERLGGTDTMSIDVRVLAATNKKLEAEVGKGAFREDLYYRLNVIPVFLPPLRERKDDVPLLIDFFLEKRRDRNSKNIKFSRDAMNELLAYDYPGNVRELENIVERCTTLSSTDTIHKEDLPPFVLRKPGENRQPTLSDVSTGAAKAHIINVLKATNGNKTKAAELLCISRKTLWEKMNTYGIDT
ncbi:MAG: sigma-54-dependent Fis family transcriptional regulator [Nitrospirae bacterium]|nr:sigma-54-dependent Fis family transcriptional regulator [Nitrospirota bacterium]